MLSDLYTHTPTHTATYVTLQDENTRTLACQPVYHVSYVCTIQTRLYSKTNKKKILLINLIHNFIKY